MIFARIAVLFGLTALLSSACSDSPNPPTTPTSATSVAGTERGLANAIADAAPVLTSMTPAAGTPGRSARVTFTGSGLADAGTTINVAGGGIRIELPFIEVTDQSLTVWFAIYADAAPGQRFISLSTAAGTTSSLPFTIGAPLPTIGTFTASPHIINVTQPSTLSWTGITNATRCTIDNGVGEVPCANGSVVVRPLATTEYMLSAIGPGGREWMYRTIYVQYPPPPGLPVTTFSQTFAFTGGAQAFTVPAGVTSITIEAFGAQGGTGLTNPNTGGAAGLGGSVRATLTVTPGTVYQVNVGGRGADGAFGVSGGAGGGGASDVRTGGNTLNDRVLVAGGGGGGGLGDGTGAGGAGGSGGGLIGANGGGTTTGAGGGGGGTQSAGGSGGGGGAAGASGTLGQGGNGGGAAGNGAGGFNGGGNGRAPGAGGGGFFGGGGGGLANAGAGGGGGSSFATAAATSVTHQQGVRSGNGLVTISWQ
jgi:hypothetical protein